MWEPGRSQDIHFSTFISENMSPMTAFPLLPCTHTPVLVHSRWTQLLANCTNPPLFFLPGDCNTSCFCQAPDCLFPWPWLFISFISLIINAPYWFFCFLFFFFLLCFCEWILVSILSHTIALPTPKLGPGHPSPIFFSYLIFLLPMLVSLSLPL